MVDEELRNFCNEDIFIEGGVGVCVTLNIINDSMAKTDLQKAIEKQSKAAQKAAREAKVQSTAQAVVDGAKFVSGFRVMDRESEDFLREILRQYDGNENNYVKFDTNKLPRYLQESEAVNFEKLKMYGELSSVLRYKPWANVTLSESGKRYFEDKQEALDLQEISTRGNVKDKMFDVFISHANKDKLTYVDQLYSKLSRLGIKIWYDTESISWGDNFKSKILDGVANSEFAIIVISKQFFGREWTEKELNELLQRQNNTGQKIILPILYDISLEDLVDHYPDLADIQVLFADKISVEDMVILFANELIKRLKNDSNV